MKNPHSTDYNIPSVITFAPETDTALIKDAAASVLKAHPSIFVHFDIRDNQVVAIRNEEESCDIPVMEMTEEECETFKGGFVKAFHLNRGPLFELVIVKTDKAVRLFTDFHHLVFDGFSMSIFLRDLGRALKIPGTPPDTEGASYFAYVKNQKDMFTEERKGEYGEYFGRLFEDYESATELPADRTGEASSGNKCCAYGSIHEEKVTKACSRFGFS